MKAFAELYAQLDATTSSNAKLAAMRDYFEKAAAEDAAWAVYFLSGGRPRQLVPTRVLREQAMTLASLPEWLFEESYQAVGDLAETLSLLLPQVTTVMTKAWPPGWKTSCCHCAVCRLKNSPSGCRCSGRSWTAAA